MRESSGWRVGVSHKVTGRDRGRKREPGRRRNPFGALSQPRDPNNKIEKGKMTSRQQPLCQPKLPVEWEKIEVKCNLEITNWCMQACLFGFLSTSCFQSHFVSATAATQISEFCKERKSFTVLCPTFTMFWKIIQAESALHVAITVVISATTKHEFCEFIFTFSIFKINKLSNRHYLTTNQVFSQIKFHVLHT